MINIKPHAVQSTEVCHFERRRG